MNVKEIKTIATNFGIKTSKLTKVGLINMIQKEEGNNECYATDSVSSCGQDECLWRDDCVKTVK